MITLTVNGKPRALEGPTDLPSFLRAHQLQDTRFIAVALNGTVLPRTEYDQVTLQDGDSLEIVHMVGGG